MPAASSHSSRPLLIGAGMGLLLALAAGVLLLLRPDAPDGTDTVPVATDVRGPDSAPHFQGQTPVRPVEDLPRGMPLEPRGTGLPAETRIATVAGPRGTIEGLAVDQARRPVPGVRISLHRGNPMFAGQFPGMRQATDVHVVSDAQGRFRIEQVPVERAYVLIGEHEDFARSEAGGIGVLADQTTSGVVLVMSEGAVIRGTVVTTTGAPIPDARVELYYLLDINVLNPAEMRPWKVMFTDAGGQFAFTNVSSTSLRVRVEAREFETQTRNLTYVFEGKPRDEMLRFELDAGTSLPGRVVSADGKPLPGARLEANAVTQGEHGSSIAISDANGYFILDGLSTRHTYQLLATCPGYTDRRLPSISTTAGTLQVVMDQRGVAIGRVVDVQGRPVTSYELALLRSFPGREPAGLGDVRPFRSSDGSFRFDNIDPGDYALEARAAGLADSRSQVFTIGRSEGEAEGRLPVPPPVPVEIVMTAGATLRGTVRDATGTPVAKARVQLLPNNHIESALTQIFRFMAPEDERHFEVRTAADGSYSFPNVRPATYQIRASAEKSPPVAVNDIVAVEDSLGGNRPVDLTLPMSASIAGRAVDANSAPVAFCKIQIMRVGDSSFMEASTTDAEGRFSFSNLAPGNYTLMVTPVKDEQAQPMHPLLSLVAADRSKVDVFVAEGQIQSDLFIRLPPLASGMASMPPRNNRPTPPPVNDGAY